MKRFASLILVLTMLFIATGCAGNQGKTDTPTDTAETTAQIEEPAVNTGFAADTLFAGGNVLSDGAGTLSIAFLGDAVTEGGIYYDVNGKAYSENDMLDEILYYFSKKFPNKEIRGFGAATSLGGSGYANATCGATVFAYAPDIVFLEFTIADMELDAEQIEKNIEGIIAQAMALEKVPVLCMIISALPVAQSDAKYTAWSETVETEKKIAEKYGIMTVDVYGAIAEAFEKSGAESIDTWQSEYFSGGFAAPKVRESCLYYSDSVIGAIEANPAAFYSRLPEGKGVKTEVLSPDSDRLTYNGEWNTYDYSHQFVPDLENNEEMMKTDYTDYIYPRLFLGMKEARVAGSSVSFESAADSFSILTHVSMRGSIAKVYVDDAFYCAIATGTFDRRKPLKDETLYPAVVQNIIEDYTNGCVTVDLPADGQTHSVKIVAEEIEGTHLVFRFGYIVEKTAEK